MMKITEALENGRPSVSFEIFPPRSECDMTDVFLAAERIAELGPSFISVTCGAGGGNRRYTLELARKIRERTGVPTLAHLTCVSVSREEYGDRVAELRRAGIENVMALRGDPPADGVVKRDFPHASDLVSELRRSGGFCIGGACYPEVHPESSDSREDISNLKKKVDAGCDFLTTQMFFDNSAFYSFLYRLREAGITVPVIPGIMPITNAKQVRRARELSGCFVPQRFASLVDRFGPDEAAMKQAGIVYACDQIIDLFANGIRNVHVYTMNKPDVAEKITENLSDIIARR